MDAVIFVIVFLVLAGLCAMAEQWFLAFYIVYLGVGLGIFEALSYWKTHRTISTNFQITLGQEPKKKLMKWALLTALMSTMWLLVVHLAWK